ncbi:hypothetical protein ACFX1S_040763 [Malus domestica]
MLCFQALPSRFRVASVRCLHEEDDRGEEGGSRKASPHASRFTPRLGYPSDASPMPHAFNTLITRRPDMFLNIVGMIRQIIWKI